MQKQGITLCWRFAASRTSQYLQRSSSTSAVAEKTSLYDFHVTENGKMVNFAGYLLPVQYGTTGIAASHLHTRRFASIFDVSHMLQTYVTGSDAISCIESICTANIAGLPDNGGSLTVFTNETGGILDDLIVTRLSADRLYVVSNAGRKKEDRALMEAAIAAYRAQGKDVRAEFLEPAERALIAVQGPTAVAAVQQLTEKVDITRLGFMRTTLGTVAGVRDCRITRCGYTGEDGVEVSIPAERAAHIVQSLLADRERNVQLAGLGARDSLRLEAGLCLYGSDIDETISPVEAGLAWLVAKRRRTERNFPGVDVVLKQLQKDGCHRRRVGIRMEAGGPPARHDVKVFDSTGDEIGHITSGCPSPSLGGNVAMGYVREAFKKPGTPVQLSIRNKLYPAVVAKMPFLPSNYYVTPEK